MPRRRLYMTHEEQRRRHNEVARNYYEKRYKERTRKLVVDVFELKEQGKTIDEVAEQIYLRWKIIERKII